MGNKLLALNITVKIYRRHKEVDDQVGGRVSTFPAIRGGIPARITSSKAPMSFVLQGIQTQDYFQCVVWSENYDEVDIIADDILVPESGQYAGLQFRVQTVNETSVDDNPKAFEGYNKLLSIKRETPRTDEVLSG